MPGSSGWGISATTGRSPVRVAEGVTVTDGRTAARTSARTIPCRVMKRRPAASMAICDGASNWAVVAGYNPAPGSGELTVPAVPEPAGVLTLPSVSMRRMRWLPVSAT